MATLGFSGFSTSPFRLVFWPKKKQIRIIDQDNTSDSSSAGVCNSVFMLKRCECLKLPNLTFKINPFKKTMMYIDINRNYNIVQST